MDTILMRRLMVFLALMWAFPAHGAIGRVAEANSGTGSTSVGSLTTTLTIAAGSTTLCGMEINSATTTHSAPGVVSGVADGGTNTWNFVDSIGRSSGAAGIAAWRCYNCVAHASAPIVVSFSSNVTYTAWECITYSGAKTATDPVDIKTNGIAAGPVTSVTSSSFTPAVTGETSVAFFASDGAQTYTAGTGYGNLVTPTWGGVVIMASQDRASIGTGSQTASGGGTSQSNWAILVITIEPPTSAACTPSLTLLGVGACG